MPQPMDKNHTPGQNSDKNINNYYYTYNKAFILLIKTLLGTAPTCLSTIWPPLKNKIVGIFLMP
jgi:hypothetical protein